MTVLIATGIFPPDIGGPATMLQSLAKSLVERGFKIKIITYSQVSRHNLDNELDIYRVNKNLPLGLSKIFYFLKLWRLSKKADLIYAADTYSVGYFSYLLKKIFNKKYILRFTGDSAWENARAKNLLQDDLLTFQKTVYNSDIEKIKSRRQKILLFADKIIVDCEFNKKIAEEIGVLNNKIFVIYNSVEIPTHIKRVEEKTKEFKPKYSSNNEKIILTSCRLTSWKGVDQIIEILPELKKQIGPLNFLIMGLGPEKENLEKIAEQSGVLDDVRFLGIIAQEHIFEYYKIADVFILNSQYEGMSNTLLEVMAADVPIIASNCGGNPELIENNKTGILVKYGNKNDLLKSLVKLLIDKILAKELAQNAQQKVQQFNLDKMITKTIDVIKK
ncbi:MAG TPA: glycosyltransferase family 4 protein [bacterium]|nr:glycosyltransferase family 4 protein [bacterium]